jgi:pimeloyl-ACP methyl ester carboxylesterase
MMFDVDGQRVFADTGGRAPDPARETVIFVHGAGQDHSIWVLPSRYFSGHDRNVIAVDLPGHGRSGGAPLRTIEAIADWLIAVLDSAGLGEAAVVGHSLGSLAAIAAAARHPARVRAIALLGSTLPMRVSRALLEAARSDRQEAIDMLVKWGHSKSAQPGGDATAGNPMLDGARRLLERAAPGVIHTDLCACDGYANGFEHAAAVRCPALLILGGCDRLTPARSAVRLAETLPEAETVILEGCGHAMLSERPDTVLDHLTRVV